jgi:hypothetical protein
MPTTKRPGPVTKLVKKIQMGRAEMLERRSERLKKRAVRV